MVKGGNGVERNHRKAIEKADLPFHRVPTSLHRSLAFRERINCRGDLAADYELSLSGSFSV